MQQANGDLTAARIELEKVAEKAVTENNETPKEAAVLQDKGVTLVTEEVKDGPKQNVEENKTVPEKDQEKTKVCHAAKTLNTPFKPRELKHGV